MESRDKTGHENPEEAISLFGVIFQELFQKYENLIGCAETCPYVASSGLIKGNRCPHLCFSPSVKIHIVCNSKKTVWKSVI